MIEPVSASISSSMLALKVLIPLVEACQAFNVDIMAQFEAYNAELESMEAGLKKSNIPAELHRAIARRADIVHTTVRNVRFLLEDLASSNWGKALSARMTLIWTKPEGIVGAIESEMAKLRALYAE